MFANSAIAPDAGEMIEVSRFCHALDGQYQKARLGLAHGTHGHFKLRAMNGVAGLKSHDPLPRKFFEKTADFGGCVAELP